jgi:hypothetical protein
MIQDVGRWLLVTVLPLLRQPFSYIVSGLNPSTEADLALSGLSNLFVILPLILYLEGRKPLRSESLSPYS